MKDIQPDIFMKRLQMWQVSGLLIRSGVDAQTINQFEQRFQVMLPDAFRAYLTLVDGMEKDSEDSELFRFFPLSEVEPLNVFFKDWVPSSSNHYFVIADFCFRSHLYAIDLGNGRDRGSVARVFGSDQIHVEWASFEDFLSAYLQSPLNLL
jgi:hypothetical protein